MSKRAQLKQQNPKARTPVAPLHTATCEEIIKCGYKSLKGHFSTNNALLT